MTNQHRKRLKAEFKKEDVDLVTSLNHTVAETARNLAIRGGMLGRWRSEQFKDLQNAFPDAGQQSAEVERS